MAAPRLPLSVDAVDGEARSDDDRTLNLRLEVRLDSEAINGRLWTEQGGDEGVPRGDRPCLPRHTPVRQRPVVERARTRRAGQGRAPQPARIIELVDEVVLVDDDEIQAAMALIADSLGVLVEPAGAAGVAAVSRHSEQLPGERVAVLLTGAAG